MAFLPFTINDFVAFSAVGSDRERHQAEDKLKKLVEEMYNTFPKIRKQLPFSETARLKEFAARVSLSRNQPYADYPHISIMVGAAGLDLFVALEQVDRLRGLSNLLVNNSGIRNELLGVLSNLGEVPCCLRVEKEYFYAPGKEDYFGILEIKVREKTGHLLSEALLRAFALTMERILDANREQATTIKAPIYLGVDAGAASFPLTYHALFTQEIVTEIGDHIRALMPFLEFLESHC